VDDTGRIRSPTPGVTTGEGYPWPVDRHGRLYRIAARRADGPVRDRPGHRVVAGGRRQG